MVIVLICYLITNSELLTKYFTFYVAIILPFFKLNIHSNNKEMKFNIFPP